ncbi:hypothetical protein JCM5353_004218 [Sporobolomyces roseus]
MSSPSNSTESIDLEPKDSTKPASPKEVVTELEENETGGKESEEKGGEKDEVQEKDTGNWQAVFSAEANAWYFWNSATNETTWTNPKEQKSQAAQTTESTNLNESDPTTSAVHDGPTREALPPIDPDLAWLDPTAARATASGSGAGTQAARFNARTGRFQVDPKFTPDRISDFQRGHRQQEVYYDVKGWEHQLEGKGLKRSAEESEEGNSKRTTAKQVERFRKQKEEKKKKKLTAWLQN